MVPHAPVSGVYPRPYDLDHLTGQAGLSTAHPSLF